MIRPGDGFGRIMHAHNDHERRAGMFRRLQLVGPDGRFLDRVGIDLNLLGVYLHRIDQADPGLDLHDHPWPFLSIVLRGGYTEEVVDTREAGRAARRFRRSWLRGSAHRLRLHEAHRIIDVLPGTVTLVLRGRKQRQWGFYLPYGWVDQQKYDYATRRPVSEHHSG